MHPRQDSVGYQKQKYCAHNESDIRIDCEDQTNKQYTVGVSGIKKAHKIAGRTFVIISQEIVDKLCINEDTFFQQNITGNGIDLRILKTLKEGGSDR